MSNIGRNDMNLHGLILALVALAVAVPVLGQEPPPPPYLDQGACPFEGCMLCSCCDQLQLTPYQDDRKI